MRTVRCVVAMFAGLVVMLWIALRSAGAQPVPEAPAELPSAEELADLTARAGIWTAEGQVLTGSVALVQWRPALADELPGTVLPGGGVVEVTRASYMVGASGCKAYCETRSLLHPDGYRTIARSLEWWPGFGDGCEVLLLGVPLESESTEDVDGEAQGRSPGGSFCHGQLLYYLGLSHLPLAASTTTPPTEAVAGCRIDADTLDGLSCVVVSYQIPGAMGGDVREWVAPGRDYRLVRREHRYRGRNGEREYLAVRAVSRFVRPGDALWLPARQTDCVYRRPTAGDGRWEPVVRSCIISENAALAPLDEALFTPLLPNPTSLAMSGDGVRFIGDDTSSLERAFREGRFPDHGALVSLNSPALRTGE